MFEFIGTMMRNPSAITRHARRLWASRKAVREFRKTHKACAWCGRTRRVQVHHVIPVSIDPSLAADPDNMIMLCARPNCHLVVGHDGNFRSRYVANVREICAAKQVEKTVKSQS